MHSSSIPSLHTLAEKHLLLEAHRHIVVGDELHVLVSRAPVQTDHFQHAFALLQQNQRFFVALALDEVKGSVRELGKNDWDFVLVDFDLFVVHLVEGV